MQEMPVYKPAREQFERTECGCAGCRVGCKTMPGFCGVGDVERIAAYLKREPDAQFLTEFFEHSEGAKLVARGELFEVPTINPAQRPDGSCVFLKPDGGCAVHPVSPFGCAYFDVHQSRDEGDERAIPAYVEVLNEQVKRGKYFQQLRTLIAASKQAMPTVRRRASFEIELRALREAGRVTPHERIESLEA